MSDWGVNFAIGVIQDFWFVQPFKIWIVFILCVEASRPQIRSIHNTLSYVAACVVQDRSDFSNDFKVVQHLSAACRTARNQAVSNLPASFILRRLDDLDMQSCRRNKGWKLGSITFAIIVIPALLGLVSDLLMDNSLEIAIPTLFSSFILFNTVLYELHPVVLIAPYVVIIMFALLRLGLLAPAVARIRKLKENAMQDQWKASRRSRINESSRPWSSQVLDRFLSAVMFIFSPLFPRMYSKTVSKADGRRLDINSTYEDLWKRMNMPANRQGLIVRSIDSLNESSSVKARMACDVADIDTSIAIDIPEPILQMIVDDECFRGLKGDKVTLTFLNKQIFNAVDQDSLESGVKQYVLDPPQHTESEALRSLRMSFITSSPDVAAYRVFNELLLGSDGYTPWTAPSIESLEESGASGTRARAGAGGEVRTSFSIVEFAAAMDSCLKDFSPGGVPMSEVELEEAQLDLQAWSDSQEAEVFSIVDFKSWLVCFVDTLVRTRRANVDLFADKESIVETDEVTITPRGMGEGDCLFDKCVLSMLRDFEEEKFADPDDYVGRIVVSNVNDLAVKCQMGVI